jgi:rubrerythrin
VKALDAAARGADSPGVASAVPATLAELMAIALAIENEAVERYGELADVMEAHNNVEVAKLFRRMQQIERKHAEQIREEMARQRVPMPVPTATMKDADGPETAGYDDVHYLMQPYHALTIALAGEERAARFFTELARTATVAAVRDAAQHLASEEREHVELVRQWLSKVPHPADDWALDPDPPRYVD